MAQGIGLLYGAPHGRAPKTGNELLQLKDIDSQWTFVDVVLAVVLWEAAGRLHCFCLPERRTLKASETHESLVFGFSLPFIQTEEQFSNQNMYI